MRQEALSCRKAGGFAKPRTPSKAAAAGTQKVIGKKLSQGQRKGVLRVASSAASDRSEMVAQLQVRCHWPTSCASCRR